MDNSFFPVVGVIPSLNPDKKLEETVKLLFKAGFSDVIIVDDGSRTECQSIFEELSQLPGCVVLHHDVNRGKGRGLKTAFSYYLDHYDQSRYVGVVTADADGQHLAEDIYNTAVALVQHGGETPYLSLGTRNFNEENVPFKSRNGNKITTAVFKALYGILIHDTQTGLRGISNSFLHECLTMKGERFEYEINMLIVAARKKYPIEEIQIQTVYFDSNRETHFNPIKDSIRIYGVMFRSFICFACSGLISVLVDQGLFALCLYCLFSGLTEMAAIPISTAIARILSSFVNYSMNRTMVFSAGKISGKNLSRYYILCVCQLLVSAALVTVIHMITHWNSSATKLLVDGCIFLVSYRIQQTWVFTNQNRQQEDKKC